MASVNERHLRRVFGERKRLRGRQEELEKDEQKEERFRSMTGR